MPVNIEVHRNGDPVRHWWGFLAYVGATYATHIESDPEALAKVIAEHKESYDGTDIRPPDELSYYGVKNTDAIGYQMRGIAPLPCIITQKWSFTDADSFDDDPETFDLLPGDEVRVYRS